MFYPQADTPFYGAEGLVESEKKNVDAFPGFKIPIKAILAEGHKYTESKMIFRIILDF
ncbi:hypothetical protein [Oceanobacillus iheyensis]|uniref:hypothetical protein n=1 Tax=Oceanobacillus iheyensis TaxID=182710 RepID=UPI0002FB2933|nr:hypothetical protein [Oceanobacillus iheyensis]